MSRGGVVGRGPRSGALEGETGHCDVRRTNVRRQRIRLRVEGVGRGRLRRANLHIDNVSGSVSGDRNVPKSGERELAVRHVAQRPLVDAGSDRILQPCPGSGSRGGVRGRVAGRQGPDARQRVGTARQGRGRLHRGR